MINDTEVRALLNAREQYRNDRSVPAITVRNLAEELEVIPVVNDWDRDYAIRVVDGVVVSFVRMAPYDIRVEREDETRADIFARGAAKYSALQPLVPTRPLDATDCPICHNPQATPVVGPPTCVRCGGRQWISRSTG